MGTNGIDHDQTTSGLSRRTVVRTAAWAAPAVTVVSAAPAFAVTPATQWNLTSTSWEGYAGGGRGQTSTYYMRFSITAPTNAPLTSVSAVAAFGMDGSSQIRAGLTAGSLASGSGWTRSPGSPAIVAPTWTFTRGATSGTVSLEFTFNSLIFTGAGSIGTFTFTSPGQPTFTFAILKQNAGTAPYFITSPHA